MPSFSSSQLHVHNLQRVTTINQRMKVLLRKKYTVNELQSKFKKRLFENSLPRSTQTGLVLASISLRRLSEASTSSAQGDWPQLTQQPRKIEQRYTASSSFEECLRIPFLFVVSINKDVPMWSRTQLTAWPLCAYTPTSTGRTQPRAEEKPDPALTTLHLTHLRNTPLSHRTKPPGHYHVTYGKAIHKESLKLTGKRPQTYNCCVT